MNLTNLSNMQMDVLREIGNIGAGNAATSMSKLINKKIDMQVPSVNVVGFNEVMELIGGADKLIVAILFHIHGEAPGTVYFILTRKEAESLVHQLMPDTEINLVNGDQSNELAISVLKEAGNIFTGSYLSALSDFTGINMQPSIPYLSMDMAGAILSVGLIELSHVSDYAIIIDTKINDSETADGINGQFLLLPSPDSFTKIFHALGINENE